MTNTKKELSETPCPQWCKKKKKTKTKPKLTMNNENQSSIWSKILKIVITVLTAVVTTFGLQACNVMLGS